MQKFENKAEAQEATRGPLLVTVTMTHTTTRELHAADVGAQTIGQWVDNEIRDTAERGGNIATLKLDLSPDLFS